MKRLRKGIVGGIAGLVVLPGGGADAENASDTAPPSQPTMSIEEEEIAAACKTRSVDHLTDKSYTRVEIYCTKTPPEGWKVRGVLDVEDRSDEHTPWIRSTDSALLHQWQIGGSTDGSSTPIRGTRLEITGPACCFP